MPLFLVPQCLPIPCLLTIADRITAPTHSAADQSVRCLFVVRATRVICDVIIKYYLQHPRTFVTCAYVGDACAPSHILDIFLRNCAEL